MTNPVSVVVNDKAETVLVEFMTGLSSFSVDSAAGRARIRIEGAEVRQVVRADTQEEVPVWLNAAEVLILGKMIAYILKAVKVTEEGRSILVGVENKRTLAELDLKARAKASETPAPEPTEATANNQTEAADGRDAKAA